MTDSRFFHTTKRGEIHELKEELNSPSPQVKKEAVKKVIAAMTVGKDVSILFTDVLNCMQTSNLELKKLVYLYVMSYARTQPEKVVLAVNTFKKDTQDPNPLVRALAIRTMACIRVEKVVEYLGEPLAACLKDPDPYVRKTAALCVAKLYDANKELVLDRGFIDQLRDLLSDSNPAVVANAVAALAEIDDVSPTPVFSINTHNLSKLLAALNECTEWGQIFILSSLSKYAPRDAHEAETIVERVSPRLQHANSAVVLGAIRVILKFMELITNQEAVKALCRKLAPPLVTMLSSGEPEVQYVALRNINLIVQKKPQILQHEMKVFFCKYNDPIYVKMEKLEIMIMLASDRNAEQLLVELKEYASEADIEFVRKSVRAIGRVAIKLPIAAERAIVILLDLIKNTSSSAVNYVTQESIIVIKDIFRKYPNRYESVISTLCEYLDNLDDPEAKASMIWIIGEYAERIENADEIIDNFLRNFKDEPLAVQLQLVTATVKLLLKKPKTAQELVTTALNLATESDFPDLRDRGFIYWRLLSTDPEAAKAVVLSEKPLVRDDASQLEPTLLDELTGQLSTLASVYHKPAEIFVTKLKKLQKLEGFQKSEDNEEGDGDDQEEVGNGDNQRLGAVASTSAPVPQPAQPPPSSNKGTVSGNLLELDMELPSPTQTPRHVDTASFLNAPVAAPTAQVKSDRAVLLAADKGKGMEVAGYWVRRQAKPWLELTFTNKSQVPLHSFAMQFNKNTFALQPASGLTLQTLMPGTSQDFTLPISTSGALSTTAPSATLQIAIKNNVDVFYFDAELPLQILFAEEGRLEKDAYSHMWQAIPDVNEQTRDFPHLPPPMLDPGLVIKKFESNNVFFVARRSDRGMEVIYFSVKLTIGVYLLVELTVKQQEGYSKLSVKTNDLEFVPFFSKALEHLITH